MSGKQVAIVFTILMIALAFYDALLHRNGVSEDSPAAPVSAEKARP